MFVWVVDETVARFSSNFQIFHRFSSGHFSVVYITSKEIVTYCRKGMDTGQLCQKIYYQITQGILFNAMDTVSTL